MVALKLEPHNASSPRLKKEASILEYIQSTTPATFSDVPTLFWFGKFNGDYGMAMTYFPGISAADCIALSSTIYDPIVFLQSAIDILAFLFTRRIVHRDIKPSHFIYSEHRWKLIDFGLANYVPNVKNGIVKNGIVGNGIVGNLRYASVRSHQGGSMSMCDDAISVGYIAFEWIVGELPWQHQTDYAIVKELKETTNFDPLTEYFATCMIPRYVDNVYFGFSTSIKG